MSYQSIKNLFIYRNVFLHLTFKDQALKRYLSKEIIFVCSSLLLTHKKRKLLFLKKMFGKVSGIEVQQFQEQVHPRLLYCVFPSILAFFEPNFFILCFSVTLLWCSRPLSFKNFNFFKHFFIPLKHLLNRNDPKWAATNQ